MLDRGRGGVAVGIAGALLQRAGRQERHPALLEALAAIDGSALGDAKGDRGFLPALRADGGRLCPLRAGTRLSTPLRPARLAAPGFIREVLAGIEVLLARCEHEIRAAIHAPESAIVMLCHQMLPTLAHGGAAGGSNGTNSLAYPPTMSTAHPLYCRLAFPGSRSRKDRGRGSASWPSSCPIPVSSSCGFVCGLALL